ncbi:MAG: hypothetical protein HYY21_11300, partial [Candidatus Tectomicrobia bacterium]|nr:hypothetical protein [Candidatus Tectomicrobia bacterium]
MSEYAYLIGDLILLALFGLLYLVRPQGRRAMRRTGLAMAPAGPLSEYWHTRDYWEPVHLLGWRVGHWRLGLEDLLFAFAFAGLSAGVFAWAAGARERAAPPVSSGGAHWGRAAFWVALLLALLALGTDGAGWNSIYASMASFAVLSAWFLRRNPRWLGPALATGAVAALAMWAFYAGVFVPLFPGVLSRWWKLEALSGLAVLGVPVEEPAWAFFGGIFCGLLDPHL